MKVKEKMRAMVMALAGLVVFSGLVSSAAANLTPYSPAADQNPAWSPDGTCIPFGSARSGNLDNRVTYGSGTLHILSPENRTYASACVKLTFTVAPADGDFEWFGYSLDGSANVTIAGNTTIGELTTGTHTLVVYGRDHVNGTAGSETVRFTLHPGDITGDAIVNLFDLQRLAWAFLSRPGDPNWNETADFNCDDTINIFDLQIMAWNFMNRYGPETGLLQPGDLTYLGAFRLPGGDEIPETFAYGGDAMTFNPDGDPAGPQDGSPGSLFISGFERLPYGELPNGNQVAEVSIPVPVNSRSMDDLAYAGFLQGFHDVAAGWFTNYNELPCLGMQYLDAAATGPEIHLAWGEYFQFEPLDPTHAWFDPTLATPHMRGPWYIGNQSLFSVNGYLLDIPASWADEHAEGHYLGTGRFMAGGWSGMGPVLFAYRPWIDDAGTPAPPGTHLEETVLLLYESSFTTENIERCMDNYQHPDEWEGGAWITTSTGKTAVLFAGTKGTGAKYWYGYINPAGPEYPCVYGEEVGEFPVCRLANGTPCPEEDLTECTGHTSERGWWSSRFDAEFILYDPADLARVAAGELAAWEPQPYAAVDIDEYLYLDPPEWEEPTLGTGVQRRYRIRDVAYDRNNGLLYVLERFADGAKPVVHVWRVQ